MPKIHVCDAIMGMGKTSAAINYINSAPPDKKFIFLTPYLSECDRIQEACPTKRFVQPEETRGSKLNDLRNHLFAGRNIASTHALLSRYTPDIVDLIRKQGYSLILDEVYEVAQNLFDKKCSRANLKILLRAGALSIDEQTGLLSQGEEFEDGYGSFGSIMEKITQGKVSVYGKEKSVVWLFPSDTLAAFDEIFILTFMFDAQPMRCYLDDIGLDYDYIGVCCSEDGFYNFADWQTANRDETDYSQLIHILDREKLNRVGDEDNSLSSGWFDRDVENRNAKNIKQLLRNLINIQQKVWHCPSKQFLWTVYTKAQPYMSERHVKKNFVPFNVRATNKYRDKTHLAYCVNLFKHPDVYNYFFSRGIKMNTDKWALSEMLQWLWRSAIRDGKEIWVYVPSRRMRHLLEDWIAGKYRTPDDAPGGDLSTADEILYEEEPPEEIEDEFFDDYDDEDYDGLDDNNPAA